MIEDRFSRSVKDSRGCVVGVIWAPKFKPRVIVPVFPGTNCEYDMARAFNLAGADSHILIFKNRTPKDLEESLASFKAEIEKAQIEAIITRKAGCDVSEIVINTVE